MAAPTRFIPSTNAMPTGRQGVPASRSSQSPSAQLVPKIKAVPDLDFFSESRETQARRRRRRDNAPMKTESPIRTAQDTFNTHTSASTHLESNSRADADASSPTQHNDVAYLTSPTQRIMFSDAKTKYCLKKEHFKDLPHDSKKFYIPKQDDEGKFIPVEGRLYYERDVEERAWTEHGGYVGFLNRLLQRFQRSSTTILEKFLLRIPESYRKPFKEYRAGLRRAALEEWRQERQKDKG